MGWKLFSKLGKQASTGSQPHPQPAAVATADSDVVDLFDKSWSGKRGARYDPHAAQRESLAKPSRHAAAPGRAPRGPHAGAARLPPPLPERHAAKPEGMSARHPQRQGQQEGGCSPGEDSELEAALPAGEPAPAGLHRSGSAPQCIGLHKRRPETASDSATSIHNATPGAGPEAPPLRGAGAASAPPPLTQLKHQFSGGEQRLAAAADDVAAPAPPALAAGEQEPRPVDQRMREQRASRAGAAPMSSSRLSEALAGCQQQQAQQARAQRPAGRGELRPLVVLVPPLPTEPLPAGAGEERPSQGILSTLSRSLPESRDPSVRGGAASGYALGAAGAQPEGGSQHGSEAARSTASGSGRPPASQPLPCSREGSQHGRREADGSLAALPPGHAAEGGAASLPARCCDNLLSPGAVSLLSLQLRSLGGSAGNSAAASREGSFRPLTRQLSAGGLSVALSREGSTRGGPLSRDGSMRGGLPSRDTSAAARCPAHDPLGQDCWPQHELPGPGEGWQLPPHLQPSREGSGRGHYSREGSSRGNWALLHPVAEAEPYHAALPPQLGHEPGSWAQRITSYAPMAAPAGSRSARSVDGSSGGGGADPAGSRRRSERRRQQQQFAVDPAQLNAALSALALAPASPASASPQPGGGQPQEAEEGSGHGRKCMLVGDPEWATQEGECLDSTASGTTGTSGCPSGVQGSAAARQQQPGQLPGAGGAEGGLELAAEDAELEAAAGGCVESGAAAEQKEWNRKFVRRWKAVKKRARIQAMGLRSLWKANSPADVHEPDELLLNLPQNDLGWPRFWSPSKQRPGPAGGGSGAGAAGAPHTRGVPMPRQGGGRGDFRRDPSLSTMLFGEVAEVTG